MAIKAVILDVEGTLLKRTFMRQYNIVPDAADMIDRLRRRGIAVFTASNNFHDAYAVKGRLNIDDDMILHSDQVGAKKGGRKFIQHVCSQLSISPNQLLYLGDSQNDCYEAVNSNVAFCLAAWSNPAYRYGFPIETPLKFAELVETFFLKEALWYYQINDQDSLGRNVTMRALLDPDRSRDKGITDLLKSKGARGTRTIRGFESNEYLSMHLFASVYLEGLHLTGSGRRLIWCMYPGHDGHYTSVLDAFITMISRQFHERYIPSLIQRHAPAIHASSARYQGNASRVTLDNQLQSICIDPSMGGKIVGQSVIVIDDFTTQGYSFETARNYLLNAGAISITCIAVGKYPGRYYARSPKDGKAWNSFASSPLTESDFTSKLVQPLIDADALASF